MTNNDNKRNIGIIGGKVSGGTQVQADWSQSDNTQPDYIKNKPTALSDFTNDEHFITNADVKNYKDFPEGWSKTGTMSDLISDINTDSNATTGMSYMATVSFSDLPASLLQAEMKVDVMDDDENLGKNILFTITSSDTAPYHWEYTSAYGASGTWRGFVVSSQLATVATSGSYNDLSNTPTIPDAPVQSDWNEADTSSLAYIANKPTIPTVPSNIVTGESQSYTIWTGNQSQYDNLGSYSSTTVYLITAS